MNKKEEKEHIEQTQQQEDFNSLKTQLQEKEARIQELTETAKRIQAEFENYRKMVEKRNAELQAMSNSALIKKLLPVLDSMELAIKNGSDREKLLKGVELIYAQLYSVLEEEGLQRVDCLNKKFDPYTQEVLIVERTQNKEEDNKVVEELQKGYLLKGAVLRTSKVKIKKMEE
ncbi:MAG: nucleotide exchange factor GrpE [Candidatus Woesearchaeota archaeon]